MVSEQPVYETTDPLHEDSVSEEDLEPVPGLTPEQLQREWLRAQAEALYRLRRSLQGK